MPEKLTLAVYLERRGAVKALTRIEAEVFGVPYPLVKGWAHRHGADEISQAMLDQLQEKIGRARSSTAEKAQRGLDSLLRSSNASAMLVSDAEHDNVVFKIYATNNVALLFPGFAPKMARQRRGSIRRNEATAILN